MKFYIIAHNIRSLYNIGTMFRTADALGADRLFLTGYSGIPPRKEISKVALGAEESVPWQYYKSLSYLIKKLKKEGVEIIAIEQDEESVDYKKVKVKKDTAFILGNEVRGISKQLLEQCDQIAEIPMKGKKESLNVSVTAGIVLFRILEI